MAVLSSLLALNVAYLIWYTGVQRIGAARTSMYSNVVPIVAMSVAAGEASPNQTVPGVEHASASQRVARAGGKS